MAWTTVVLGREWQEHGSIWKVKLTEFAIGLNVEYEIKRGLRVTPRLLT